MTSGEAGVWLLNSFDRAILGKLTSWRGDEIFRPTLKRALHTEVQDPVAFEKRTRKDNRAGAGEQTRLTIRINKVLAHLDHAGLVRRNRDVVTIVDRAAIRALLRAGSVTYPRGPNARTASLDGLES